MTRSVLSEYTRTVESHLKKPLLSSPIVCTRKTIRRNLTIEGFGSRLDLMPTNDNNAARGAARSHAHRQNPLALSIGLNECSDKDRMKRAALAPNAPNTRLSRQRLRIAPMPKSLNSSGSWNGVLHASVVCVPLARRHAHAALKSSLSCAPCAASSSARQAPPGHNAIDRSCSHAVVQSCTAADRCGSRTVRDMQYSRGTRSLLTAPALRTSPR